MHTHRGRLEIQGDWEQCAKEARLLEVILERGLVVFFGFRAMMTKYTVFLMLDESVF